MKKYAILLVLLVWIWAACQSGAGDQAAGNVPEQEAVDYAALGDSLAAEAQKALLSALLKAINDGDAAYAVDFCHANATGIADSLSVVHGCSISRISEKYRNTADAPAEASDTEVLANYQQRFAEGSTLKPILYNIDAAVLFYKPITIGMPACLQCHGEPGVHIDAATMAVISNRYPEDKATGYRQGDFRGAWKIRFPVR
jgi:hypothetical protein